jgi:hypothetical protein
MNIKTLDLKALRQPADFPLDCLPTVLRRRVEDVNHAMELPVASVALMGLVATAGAIGHRLRIQPKRSWVECGSLFGLVVQESGTGKSTALKAMLGPLRDAERDCIKANRQAKAAHEQAMRLFLLERKRRRAGEPEPEPPPEPVGKRVLLSEATPEAVLKRLSENPAGLTWVSDELLRALGFARYAKGDSGSGDALILELFEGASMAVDRSGKDTIYVPEASLSIVGGCQPGKLHQAFTEDRMESGMAPRFLMVLADAPPSGFGTDDDPATDEAWSHALHWIMALPLGGTVTLSDQAKAMLRRAADGPWKAMQASRTGIIRAVAGKARGKAARLALLHHTLRRATGEATGTEVDPISMEAAIRLVDWFIDEWARLADAMTDAAPANAPRTPEALEAWLACRGGAWSLRDVMKHCAAYRQHREELWRDAKALEQAGRARIESSEPGPKGGRPSAKITLVDRSPYPHIPETPLGHGSRSEFQPHQPAAAMTI